MLLLVAAVLLAVIGLAWIALATQTTDVEPAAAPGTLVMRVNGAIRCACVPVPDGCYSAKHCLDDVPRSARVTIEDVRVWAWTLDPARDLAHLPIGAAPQAVGTPAPGAVATWRGLRSGAAILRRTDMAFGPVADGATPIQRQLFDVWCYSRCDVPGGLCLDWTQMIRPGDSGGGFFVDGVLVGILSLYDPRGCGVWTVRVP